MEIWLNKDKDKFRLPVNPPSFQVTNTQNNTSIEVQSTGEVNLIGTTGLMGIEISSFFPVKEYSFVQYKPFPKPYDCVDKIKKWIKTPIQLIITGTNLNIPVTIESFSHSEEDGSGDVSFSITLKEYRTVAYKTISKKTSKSGKKVSKKKTKKRSSKEKKTVKYVVKKNDTLWGIAKKQTGKSSNWKKIYKDNKKVIEKTAKKHGKKSSSNGHWIYPGTKLVIKK